MNRIAVCALVALCTMIASRQASAYEEDTHFGLTYVLCRSVGFNQSDALLVAAADQAVDDSLATSPVGPSWHWIDPEYQFNQKMFHAIGVSTASILAHPEKMFQVALQVAKTDRNKGLIWLGVFFHYQQDTWSHRKHYEVRVDFGPEQLIVCSSTRFQPYTSPFGHFFTAWAPTIYPSDYHQPDRPPFDPRAALMDLQQGVKYASRYLDALGGQSREFLRQIDVTSGQGLVTPAKTLYMHQLTPVQNLPRGQEYLMAIIRAQIAAYDPSKPFLIKQPLFGEVGSEGVGDQDFPGDENFQFGRWNSAAARHIGLQPVAKLADLGKVMQAFRSVWDQYKSDLNNEELFQPASLQDRIAKSAPPWSTQWWLDIKVTTWRQFRPPLLSHRLASVKSQDATRVYFVAPNHAVIEAYERYDSNGWRSGSISSMVPASELPKDDSPIVATAGMGPRPGVRGGPALYYIAVDRTIHELALRDNSWQHANVSILAGAGGDKLPFAGSALAATKRILGNIHDEIHVFYQAEDGTLHGLVRDSASGTWRHYIARGTVPGSSPALFDSNFPVLGTSLAAATPSGPLPLGEPRVYYQTVSTWLADNTGPIYVSQYYPPLLDTDLLAASNFLGNSVVYYQAQDRNLIQLENQPTLGWLPWNLSASLGDKDLPFEGSPLSTQTFARSGDAYVFYRAKDASVHAVWLQGRDRISHISASKLANAEGQLLPGSGSTLTSMPSGGLSPPFKPLVFYMDSDTSVRMLTPIDTLRAWQQTRVENRSGGAFDSGYLEALIGKANWDSLIDF